MLLVARFTSVGVPATGLSATLRLLRASDGGVVVPGLAMTEIGDGWYRYDYAAYNPAIDYVGRCDGGATLDSRDRYQWLASEDQEADVRHALLTDDTRFAGADVGVIAGDVAGLDGDSMRGTDGAYTGTPPTTDEIKTKIEEPGSTLAVIAADVDGLDGAAMRGTDGSPTAAEIRTEVEGAGTKLSLVKDQTDLLPADPASQSGVEAAITASEGAVRGVDGDDLQTLSLQIDGVQSEVGGLDGAAMRGTDGANTTTPPTAVEIRTEVEVAGGTLALAEAQTAKLHFDGANVQARVADKGVLRNPPSEVIGDYHDQMTEGELHTGLDSYGNKGDYKASGFPAPGEYDAALGTLQADVTFIRHIEGGRWKIESDQMIFYEADGTTEIARFNLFNAAGVPAMADVFDRRRVP